MTTGSMAVAGIEAGELGSHDQVELNLIELDTGSTRTPTP